MEATCGSPLDNGCPAQLRDGGSEHHHGGNHFVTQHWQWHVPEMDPKNVLARALTFLNVLEASPQTAFLQASSLLRLCAVLFRILQLFQSRRLFMPKDSRSFDCHNYCCGNKPKSHIRPIALSKTLFLLPHVHQAGRRVVFNRKGE